MFHIGFVILRHLNKHKLASFFFFQISSIEWLFPQIFVLTSWDWEKVFKIGFYWDLWCLLTNWYLLVSAQLSFPATSQTCFTKNSGRLFWCMKHLSLYTLTCSMHFLLTVLNTFPKVLTRKICLPIKRFLLKRPFFFILMTLMYDWRVIL